MAKKAAPVEETGAVAARPLSPEVEAEVDRLYGLPLAEFTPARNELAARLRAGGGAGHEASAAVKALGKPTLPAWAANQMWRRQDARARVDAFLAASERLHGAVAGGGGGLAAAQQAQRDALAQLQRAAAEVLQSAGHAAAEATLQKVCDCYRALAADAGARARFAGRLERELTPPGFEALAALAGIDAAPASGSIAPTSPPSPSSPPSPPSAVAMAAAARAQDLDARRRRVEDARAVLARAEREAAAAREAARAAEVDAEQALRRAQDAGRALERARVELAARDEAVVRARDALRDAEGKRR